VKLFNPRRLALTCLLVSTVIAATGCRDEKPKQDEQKAPPEPATTETAEQTEEPPPPPRRQELERWRSLIDEVPRAELRVGGLHIDFGTADSFKYNRGGWENRWADVVADEDGTTATKLDGGDGPIDFVLRQADEAPREIVARLRARCGDQKIGVSLDGESLGEEKELPQEWTTVRFPVSGEVGPGRHVLTLQPDRVCKGKARAHVDWVWLSEKAGAEPPEIVERARPVKLDGGLRRALNAPSARTYSFYLHVPESGELVFDHGSSADAEFAVSIATDGEEPKEVYRKKASSEWAEGSVDLAPWATKAVRIDLTTSGNEGETGWGEVELMVPELPEPPEIADPGARPKNIVYILIDTQRADSFEPFGGEGSAAQTPTFDALTKDSIVFSRAFNQENWTKPSVATILSGLYPVTHDTSGEEETVPDAVEMLAERLNDNGLTTGAFIANGYISRDFGFNQGWDYYTNFLREGKNGQAKNVYRNAIDWVEKNHDKPFFLYVQTIDPHVPWNIPDEYKKLYYDGKYTGRIGPTMGGAEQKKLSGNPKMTEDDYKWVNALYNGEVSYQDKHMGKLVDKLKDLGVFDDTLFIISNDHGEELNDHGEMGHRHTLYNELLRSPLLMRYPDRLPPGQQYDDIVELVDMAPTILDLMGFAPSEVHEGISLVPLIEGHTLQRPRYTIAEYEYNSRYGPLDIDEEDRGSHERSVIVGRWKLWRDHREHKMLFDLKADPGEQENMLGKAPIALRLTEVYLAEGLANPNKKVRLLNRMGKKQFQAGSVEIEGELRKQLEALGYFGEE
jgi:arylsulfatase A-like enzyme